MVSNTNTKYNQSPAYARKQFRTVMSQQAYLVLLPVKSSEGDAPHQPTTAGTEKHWWPWIGSKPNNKTYMELICLKTVSVTMFCLMQEAKTGSFGNKTI